MKKIPYMLIASAILLNGCGTLETDEAVDTTQEAEVVAEGEVVVMSNQEKAEAYKKEQGITLDAKDVQFDTANHLDENFFIEGTATLDDYYNYGYKDEAGHFVVTLKPDDGSDYWHLYFGRKDFAPLFEELKEKGSVNAYYIGRVRGSTYVQGQGNMAIGLYAEYKN